MTTLKRNGSDYSATILGALFRAGHITIWTDVDGVFSADPRKVGQDATLIFFPATDSAASVSSVNKHRICSCSHSRCFLSKLLVHR